MTLGDAPMARILHLRNRAVSLYTLTDPDRRTPSEPLRIQWWDAPDRQCAGCMVWTRLLIVICGPIRQFAGARLWPQMVSAARAALRTAKQEDLSRIARTPDHVGGRDFISGLASVPSSSSALCPYALVNASAGGMEPLPKACCEYQLKMRTVRGKRGVALRGIVIVARVRSPIRTIESHGPENG